MNPDNHNLRPVEMVDFRGKAFAPGQTVVYPVRQSSSLWLEQGTVVLVDARTGSVRVQKHKGTNKVVTLRSLDRLVIVSEATNG